MRYSIPQVLEGLILSRYKNHMEFAHDLQAIKLALVGKVPLCSSIQKKIESIIIYSALLDSGYITFVDVCTLNPTLMIENCNALNAFLLKAESTLGKTERHIYKDALEIGKEMGNPFLKKRIIKRLATWKKVSSL